MRVSSVCLGILGGPCICFWIGISACFCPSRHHRHNASDDKRRFERRQRNAPRPLVKRKRALTIPMPCEAYQIKDGFTENESEKLRQTTKIQSQSQLLRLPRELREMIYGYVLGGEKLHIVRKETKLGHLRCQAERECPITYGPCRCWRGVDEDGIWMPELDFSHCSDGDILPLLATCRQVYSEAIPIVYTTNTFSFNDLDCIRHLACTILSHRFNSIKHMELQWHFTWPFFDYFARRLLPTMLYPPNDEASWDGVWSIIAEMKGLQTIKVMIEYASEIEIEENEKKMLEPLWKIRDVRKFEVFLPWRGGMYEGAPFNIIREVEVEDEDV